MTRSQRAQVVELLRCAADHHPSLSRLVGFTPKTGTAGYVAWAAKDAIQNDKALTLTFRYPNYTNGGTAEGLRLLYLEAAARVEEGTWP